MAKTIYDIIVIGCGSGGLSTGIFMAKTGLKVLMVSKSDHDIGGDCLNDGCVPSKSFIHVAKIAEYAKRAELFGLSLNGKLDIKKAIHYVFERQEEIREHENAAWIRAQGIDLALGIARFAGKNSIEVEGETYFAKKIVIATGSTPRKIKTPGIEKVKYYDNESIFKMEELPERLLVIGGGPIGIEIAQAMQRLGSKVTLVHKGKMILNHEEPLVSTVLFEQLKKEGIQFYLDAKLDHFLSSNHAQILSGTNEYVEVSFDAVFVGIGRELDVLGLEPEKAGIEVKEGKILLNKYLQTCNKNVYVCGDMAADLQFSHAAEFHARILLNNFFSPFKKKLDNKHLSWVTFTDPELATFGLNVEQLNDKKVKFVRLDLDFNDEDRAVTDNYQYGKMILYLSKESLFKKQTILGGTMIAPNAGELIQELILAMAEGLSINSIFNKIYPYPVASRINQKIIVEYRSKVLTEPLMKLLRLAYKIFS